MLVRCTCLLQRWWVLSGHSVSVRFQASNAAVLRRKTWMMHYLSNTLKQLHSGRSLVAYKTSVVLGIGTISGITLFLFKYYNADRAFGCSESYVPQDWTHRTTWGIGPNIDLSETAKVSVQQFRLVQRLYLIARFVYLCFLFFPAAFLCGVSHVFGSPSLAGYGCRYILSVLDIAGPAFIKLAQWASMRRDLFSEDFCQTLSHLHSCCPCHSWPETVQQLDDSLGPFWRDQLVIDDHTPIGSGSVAQVYQGRLSVRRGVSGDDADAIFVPVAVKVLHPNTALRVRRDIFLMKYVASWIDAVYPDVYWVAFTECVDQFSSIIEKQLDLEFEARNLLKFQNNTTSSHNIKFPTPLYPYVTKEILVESFEPGHHISEYLGNPGGEVQKSLAKIGIEALFDMMFVHNFVHGDLHPGNILVQDISSLGDYKLVMLDCGIATTLSPLDWENLHCVFTAIIKGQGEKVADLFLGKQHCSTLQDFRRKMTSLVDTAMHNLNLENVRIDSLISDLFKILIEHKVRLDPNFTAVMTAIMVIEGLGRSLDPSLDILAYARPCLLQRTKLSIRKCVSRRLNNIILN